VLEDLVEVVGGPALPGWAAGRRFKLPLHIAAEIAKGEVPTVSRADMHALRSRAAFTETKPTSSRLPVNYQIVPVFIRDRVGKLIGQRQRARVDRWADFPQFPLDLSADLLADFSPRSVPRTGPVPVILSHDLDTHEGLANLVRIFLPIEESAGAHSTNYIVPCSWPIDHDLLGQVSERGNEIGIHGYNHANKTPYAEPAERRRRLEATRELVERYSMIGYRAPSLVRTQALMEDLADFFVYDSSIPTSGGLFPVPNNGCASARPFRIGRLAEIPISLPRDGSLLFLGYTPNEILSIWIECAEAIADSGGVVMLLTHCEDRFLGQPAMQRVYRIFLDHIAASERFFFSTPADVLSARGLT
jgi:peptidoglycan/xylan/chitin deacetylase (PgdA/CDA1 family)